MAVAKPVNNIVDLRTKRWHTKYGNNFIAAAKPMDWILDPRARDMTLLHIMQWIQDRETIS